GRFLRHEPIRARATGRVGQFIRWVRRRPAVAGMLAAVVLLVMTGVVITWLLYQQRAAVRVRQGLTDQEVRQTVQRARGLLDGGWQAHARAKLTEAEAEGRRAVQTARGGAASAAVQHEAETFLEEAGSRRGRAEKIRVGRADEAEDILQEFIRDEPQNPTLYPFLGAALGAQHKYSAAEAVCRKGVDLRPDSAAMHNNLGVALARQRKYADAEAAYRKAIDLRPGFAKAYGNLAVTLGEQGKLGEAEAALRKAIDRG